MNPGTVIRWNSSVVGPLTLDEIQIRHQPQSSFRISYYAYSASTRFGGSSRSGLVYVLEGVCRYQFDDTVWDLHAPCYAELPEGRFQFEVVGQTEVSIVHVWDLSKWQALA